MRHLLNLGHRKILAITAQTGSQYTEQQLAGTAGAPGIRAETERYHHSAPARCGKKRHSLGGTDPQRSLRNAPAYGNHCIQRHCGLHNGARPLPARSEGADDISIITYDPWYAELTTPTLTTVVLGEIIQNPPSNDSLTRWRIPITARLSSSSARKRNPAE